MATREQSRMAAADAPFADAAPASVASASPQQAAPQAVGAGASAQLSASLGNPAALQRIWQSALSSLKKEKAAFGVLFLNTKAVFDASAGALAIDFPVENTFAFKAAQKPDVQDAVASALERACGERLAFSYTQGAQRVSLGGSHIPQEPQASAQVQARSPQPEPQPQPQVREFVEPVVAAASAVPATGAAAPAYADDAVPYDDDAVPYDDDAVPYGDPAFDGGAAPYGEPASAEPAFQDAPSRMPYERQPDQGAAASSDGRVGIGPDPAASAAPAEPVEDARDLQAILAAGFGDGVTFEEVRE